MARALYYPPASQTAQWFNDNYRGSDIEPNVLVWHTTETGHWPGYGGGASAPHLTYHAEDHDWRQHFRLDRSSRALRNAAGGVETNTLNACQVEIIAYSDESLARSRGHLPVSDLDDRALRDLGEFAAFMWDEWGLKLDIDPGWVRSNYVTAPPMSHAQWRGFYGHTGHNRVPENTHWDPARLDIDTIIGYALEDDMPITRDDARMIAEEVANYGTTSLATGNASTLLNQIRWGHRRSDTAAERAQPTRRIESKVDALIASNEGLDTEAIIDRINEVAAEGADERAEIADLVAQVGSGEATAEDVVRLIGEKLANTDA